MERTKLYFPLFSRMTLNDKFDFLLFLESNVGALADRSLYLRTNWDRYVYWWIWSFIGLLFWFLHSAWEPRRYGVVKGQLG